MADADGAPPRRVAWVTGGSRGVGRGVAVALGQAGWKAYVTAPSSVDGRTGHLPGTVEQTADEVTASGGFGVAVPCDHRDDDAVRAVAARITADHGRLDLLVNNAWSGYERLNAGGWEEWNAPFWEQPLELAVAGRGRAGHRRAGRRPGGDGPDRAGADGHGPGGALWRRRVLVEGRGPDVQEGGNQGVLVVEGRGAGRGQVVQALAEPGQRAGQGRDVLAGQPLPGARVGVDLRHRGVGEGLHLLRPQRLQARVGPPVLHDGAQDRRAPPPQFGPGGDAGAQRGHRVGRDGQPGRRGVVAAGDDAPDE